MDEATATKVPQTGSFFSSPPDCCLGMGAGPAAPPPAICENALMINTTTWRMKSATMKTRKSRKTFRIMLRKYSYGRACSTPTLLLLCALLLCVRILIFGRDLRVQHRNHPLGRIGVRPVRFQVQVFLESFLGS